jgi:hypothetical protein
MCRRGEEKGGRGLREGELNLKLFKKSARIEILRKGMM